MHKVQTLLRIHMHIITRLISINIFLFCFALNAQADSPAEACRPDDKSCMMGQLESVAHTITEERWRDQTYRELAKTYTYAGNPDKAIALIDKIINNDTKAMTIRGIGFAAADSKWQATRYAELFQKLESEAQKIDHAPSHAIALTYIAMSQAFAGDDEGATKTAKSMKNDALRNKAFGETAEIQAERRDFDAAMASISHINTSSFRNKAYRIVSKIFTNHGAIAEAYQSAILIDNAYMKAEALQYILNHDNSEESLRGNTKK